MPFLNESNPLQKRKIAIVSLAFCVGSFPFFPGVCSYLFPEINPNFDVNVLQNLCIYFSVFFLILLTYFFKFIMKRKKTAICLFYLDFLMLLFLSGWYFTFGNIYVAYEFRYLNGIVFYIFFSHFLVFFLASLTFVFYIKKRCGKSIEVNKEIWDFEQMIYSDNTSAIALPKIKYQKYILKIFLSVIFILYIYNLFYEKFLFLNIKLVISLTIFSWLNFAFIGYFLPWKGFQIYYLHKRLKNRVGDMLIKELLCPTSKKVIAYKK
ncbi:hypothetical protein [Legionella fairfieldensis]|uniref:hypothetical protein n=1 Tax=Legionella fairfieldensis TaxID=45064 RepID=UPI00048BBB90|nr:hypothetical protein [Legionella fairfieldensis]